MVIRRPTRPGRRAGGLKQTGLAVMATILADTTSINCRPIPVHISTICVEPQINKSGINQNNLIKVNCHRQQIANNKAISTCLLNVRSTQYPWLLTLTVLDVENELDVLALTETWLKETDSTESHTVSEMTSSGYKCLHLSRSREKGGGVGVGILYRSCVGVKQASSSSFRTFENIHVCLKAGSSHLNICVIYRPPTKWIDSRWLLGSACPNFEDTMQQPANLVVMGDFNFHWDNRTVTHANSVTSSTQMSWFVREMVTQAKSDYYSWEGVRCWDWPEGAFPDCG